MVDYDWDEDQENVWPWDGWDEESWDYSLYRRFDDCGDCDGYEGDELPELTRVDYIKLWLWNKQDQLKYLWSRLMVKLHPAQDEEIPF